MIFETENGNVTKLLLDQADLILASTDRNAGTNVSTVKATRNFEKMMRVSMTKRGDDTFASGITALQILAGFFEPTFSFYFLTASRKRVAFSI